MNHLYFYGVIVLGLFLWTSCDSLNESEPVPSFIKIDSISLSTNYAMEGSNSSEILDAWVYVENSLLGVFELPALVPYLGEGESSVNVFAGIKNNGMIENRSQYEFYDKSSDELFLTSGETVSYNPTVFYKEVEFVINDNFDFSTQFEIIPASVNWSNTENPDEVFEGERTMRISLNEDNPEFKMQSAAYYTLEPDGRGTYIELDYKTSQNFTVGIIPLNSGLQGLDEPVISFIATDEWRKEYISIGGYINALNADAYAVYINADLGADEESETFFFDNLKLIQY